MAARNCGESICSAYFLGQLVVGGYDDQKVYFIDEGQVVKRVATGKGAFQLLVRERAS